MMNSINISNTPMKVLRLNYKIFSVILLSVMFLLIQAVSIQQTYAASSNRVAIGGWYLEPTVDVTYGRSDLEFGENSVRSSDSFVQVNPKVAFRNETKDREILLSYELDAVRFSDNSEGDFESSFVTGEYRRALTDRSDISLRGEYEESSQTNGIRAEILAINPIDENQRIDSEARELLLKYEFYGEQRAEAGHLFEVSFAIGEREFEAPFVELQGRDFDYTEFEAKWRYLWSKGRGVFANLRARDLDYSEVSGDVGFELDNQQTEIIVGYEFQTKQSLSGEIGAGVVRKSFDEIEEDFDVPTFYAELEFVPTPLNTFQLRAQQRPIEQAGFGAFQELKEIDLRWLRRLSPRWSFEAYIGIGEIDYEESDREDEFEQYGLTLEYRLSRNADLIFGYRFYDDDSNQDIFDYNGDNWFITYSTGF